jgi:hypothetical protein
MNFNLNISELLVIVTILMFSILGFLASIKFLIPITKEYYQYNEKLTSRAIQKKKTLFLLEQKKKIQALYLCFLGSFCSIVFCIYTIINTIF